MGFLRVFLAICVISTHTNSGLNFGVSGREAVILFYIISGFYMALVLNNKYTKNGCAGRFYAARYTRLWLPYIPVIIISLGIFIYTGKISELAKAYSMAPLWLSVLAIISNFIILGQDFFWLISYSSDSVYFLPFGESGHNGFRLMVNRPLFSVGIELYFYLLAPFLLKSINRSFFLLFIGFLWLTITSYLGYERNVGLQYHAAPSAFMYFGLGAVSYHLSKLEQSYKAYFFLLVSGLLVVNSSSLINGWLPLFMGLTIPMVFNLVKENIIDNFIGEFSYLLYITHMPVMTLLKSGFGLSGSLNLFLYTLFLSLFISVILYYSVDRYVAMYRAKKYGSGH